MARKKGAPDDSLARAIVGFLEAGDKNSQGYIVIVVFAILAVLLVFSYFYPGSGDPF